MKRLALFLATSLFLTGLAASRDGGIPLTGTWRFVSSQSTDLATWRSRTPQLKIVSVDKGVAVVWSWIEGKAIAAADTIIVHTDGRRSTSIVRSAVWPENWFMGVLSKEGSERVAQGRWLTRGRSLEVRTRQTVRVSQGETMLETIRTFSLDNAGGMLRVVEQRSSRPTPITLVFERIGTN